MIRRASVDRRTAETAITLDLVLDGKGGLDGKSGIGFFDHLLSLLAHHAGLDLKIQVSGDFEVDGHHTVEDLGLALGSALAGALGDKAGIARYGQWLLPMDEALVLVALDLSGRPYLDYRISLTAPLVGELDTQLVEEFLRALVTKGGITLHVRKLAGRNAHHVLEAVFKGLGRALGQAVAINPAHDGIPSTKGIL